MTHETQSRVFMHCNSDGNPTRVTITCRADVSINVPEGWYEFPPTPLHGLDNPEPTVRSTFTYDGTQEDWGDVAT